MSDPVNNAMSARCAVHPEVDAHALCERCGSYACVECLPIGSVSNVCVTCETITGASRYHAVPMWRFLLLNLVTFSFYQSYWFYMTWRNIKRTDRSDIWPLARTIFAGFTYFSLLTDINLFAVSRSVSAPTLSSAWAVGYVISSLLFRLPEPWSTIIPMLSFVFLIPAVRRTWELSSESTRSKNARWSTRHTLLMVTAVPVWALIIVGLYLSEDAH